MKENQTSLLYNIDDIPPLGETLILGFQHYLTMFGSTVAIPLLLSPAFGLDDPNQPLSKTGFSRNDENSEFATILSDFYLFLSINFKNSRKLQ